MPKGVNAGGGANALLAGADCCAGCRPPAGADDGAAAGIGRLALRASSTCRSTEDSSRRPPPLRPGMHTYSTNRTVMFVSNRIQSAFVSADAYTSSADLDMLSAGMG